ncbi:MAG: EutP/PduV family microcompartment system protein [Eubacteriales bacterium]|nr:EutP/PduV family microcompartment system protein [Eubacteriales bacterium]
MGKVLFIGKSGSGKTTLCQKLNEQDIRYRKTQMVEAYQASIDTPGEYLENPRFYKALIVSAADAGVVALVSDPTSAYLAIPPGFAKIFQKPVIGIVTKILEAGVAQIERSRQELLRAKAEPVFLVDTPEGVGIEALAAYLEEHLKEKGTGVPGGGRT